MGGCDGDMSVESVTTSMGGYSRAIQEMSGNRAKSSISHESHASGASGNRGSYGSFLTTATGLGFEDRDSVMRIQHHHLNFDAMRENLSSDSQFILTWLDMEVKNRMVAMARDLEYLGGKMHTVESKLDLYALDGPGMMQSKSEGAKAGNRSHSSSHGYRENREDSGSKKHPDQPSERMETTFSATQAKGEGPPGSKSARVSLTTGLAVSKSLGQVVPSSQSVPMNMWKSEGASKTKNAKRASFGLQEKEDNRISSGEPKGWKTCKSNDTQMSRMSQIEVMNDDLNNKL